MSSYGSGQVFVTYETIAQAAQNVQRTYQSLTQKLDDLHNFLAPLVSEWSGAASEQYQAKQAQWNSAQQDLGQVLQAIGRVLEETNSSYQETESANTRAWS